MRTSRRTSRRTTAALSALAVGLTLALGACGDDEPEEGSAEPTSESSPSPSDSPTDPSTGEHNAADVEFASQMIPHHAQALQMVDMADERENLSPQFEQLLDDIEDAQEREIDQMAGWLREWGEEVPPTDGADHSGHESHSGGDMGMMTAEDMDELMRTPDAAFEGLWLTMMIEHHEGAISMAEAQQEQGQYPPAVELAQSIVTSQRAEITKMESMIS